MQEAAGLDPEANRDRLAELTPEGADLVVFPEAFARDFGEAGSDVSEYAEGLDGPFVQQVAATAAAQVDHRRGRHVRDQRRPGPPPQHAGDAGRRGGGVPEDPPLRLVRLPRVRPAGGRPRRADRGQRRRLAGGADDLLRPEVPGARPAARRPRRRAAGAARRPGSPAPARWTTGPPWCGPGRSRTPCSWPRPPSPARATAATRWSWTRSATCSPRPATDRPCCGRGWTTRLLVSARATNPSLANRRL